MLEQNVQPFDRERPRQLREADVVADEDAALCAVEGKAAQMVALLEEPVLLHRGKQVGLVVFRDARALAVENGRRAHDMALLLGVDLILMDIEMPGVNGLEAARQVIAKLPGCKVIFVTAYGLFQYAYEAMRLGACGYILKPVVPDEAEGVIRKALAQIEAERKLADMAPAAVESVPEQDADAASAAKSHSFHKERAPDAPCATSIRISERLCFASKWRYSRESVSPG